MSGRDEKREAEIREWLAEQERLGIVPHVDDREEDVRALLRLLDAERRHWRPLPATPASEPS